MLMHFAILLVWPLSLAWVPGFGQWRHPRWSKFFYSAKYGTDQDHVYVEPKPHDCDFDKAPLGDKECHFEKGVTSDKAADGKVSVYVGWQKVDE